MTNLLLAPEWLVHRYSRGHDAVHFVNVSRRDRAAASFLTDAALGQPKPLVVSRRDAMSVAPPAAPLHFIFHSAFCCSTLLANALDLMGIATTLKEPVILNDLIGWRHGGSSTERLPDVLRDVLILLARPFEDGEAVIIKPSNVVNELAPDLLSLCSSSSAVFMEAPLEEFVASVALKGLEGRVWVRDLLAKQLKGGLVQFGFSLDDLLRQTDLQAAALGWLVQHKLFCDLRDRWPDRLMWLSSSDLLAYPQDRLAEVARHFALQIEDARMGTVVASVFKRNSKTGAAFDARDRRQRYSQAKAWYGDEISKTVAWTMAVAESVGVRLEPHMVR